VTTIARPSFVARPWDAIARWYSIPLLIVVWQVAVASGLVQSRLLPSPVQVWSVLVAEIANGALVYHASVTLARALSGFFLAALVGIPFAAAMARSALWRNLFEPIFFLGYPIPKIALFPIFTYMFGIGSPSKISFVFLECLYPIVVTCYFGFRAIPTRLIWTAQNLGASRATIFRRVIIPSALPSILSGLRIALPIAIIVVVITEMIGDSIGLGYYITIWSTRFSFANVYAAIVVIGLCGFVLDRGMAMLQRRLVYWQREK
jgi:NitT/TauT family transport system permease protein